MVLKFYLSIALRCLEHIHSPFLDGYNIRRDKGVFTFSVITISSPKPSKHGYPTEYNHIGDYVKKTRLDKDLLQEELAHEFNISVATLSNWENGKHEPRVKKLSQAIRFIGHDPFEKKEDYIEDKLYNYMRKNGLSAQSLADTLELDSSNVSRAIKKGYSSKSIAWKRASILLKI